MLFISIFSILVKLSNIWLPFSSNCTDSCSCIFKKFGKKCHNFSRGEGVKSFAFFHIFYVTIIPGGVSPQLLYFTFEQIHIISSIKIYKFYKLTFQVKFYKYRVSGFDLSVHCFLQGIKTYHVSYCRSNDLILVPFW